MYGCGRSGQFTKTNVRASAGTSAVPRTVTGVVPAGPASETVTQSENSDVLLVAAPVSVAVTTSPISRPGNAWLKEAAPSGALTSANETNCAPSPSSVLSHAAFEKNSTK